jgi:hypothetical protein
MAAALWFQNHPRPAGAEGCDLWRARRFCRVVAHQLPYVQRVPEDLREQFIAAVAERYTAWHPADADGKVHVRMVRLEIDAVKV